jgi:alkanesulfonate monooxygenase SsuD/methylene tetrahydromethanopterin reductase-like flavin-dependent oxidoreductase (luciferase family)
VALAAAAGATSELLLGTGIALLPQRDLIHTAKEVASLDLVSDGRVLFGVGVGWNREEMRYVDLDPIFGWPKPVQRPHVSIYIGGESEAALNRLAKYGDGWLLRGFTRFEEVQRVRRWLNDQGRADVQFAVFGGDTRDKVIDGFREAGVERYTFLLETLPETETLKALDELAEVATRHR